MNLDANVQKTLMLLLRKWKLIVIFALIGTILAFIYTANFSKLAYSSSVEFLATAVDPNTEMSETSTTNNGDYVRTSNTSKMNYAMQMISTYVEIFQTNEFCSSVADELNKTYGTSYSASLIKSSVTIETVEETPMFKMTVSTHNADLSYEIATQLASSVPKQMKNTNDGLVQATVQDSPIKAEAASSLGYPKKCLIGFLAGAVLAAAYIILRDLIDVRIRTSEDLFERYDIPVLGSVPDFRIKKSSDSYTKNKKGEENYE